MKDITVIMPLYNKEKYFSKAIESVLNQKGEFDLNILIIDDCSTDSSYQLAAEYEKKYSDIITLAKNEQNSGLCFTIRKAYHMLTTTYFCVLDADDYWINDHKLIKAIDFLEEHTDFSIYESNMYKEDSLGNRISAINQDSPDIISSSFFEIPQMQTSATVFRNCFTEDILNEIDDITGSRRVYFTEGDAFRNVFNIHYGKCYFENSVDAVWRVGDGDWSSMSKLEESVMNFAAFYEFFYYKYRKWNEVDTYCLSICKSRYNMACDELVSLFKTCKALDWKCSKYFGYFSENDDIIGVITKILEYGNKMNEIGLA